MNPASGEIKPNNADPQPSASAPKRSVVLADHRIDSRDLFVGTREVVIAHGADLYRLRLTAQNKLILTK